MQTFIWPQGAIQFPDADTLRHSSDTVVAVGGDLSVEQLTEAYRLGIFPFYESPPILWWSPARRAVIFSDRLHVSGSLKRILAKSVFDVTFDQDFDAVITGCAQRPETWITEGMKRAYLALHHEGLAHSVEVWHEGELAGGLYGVALGRIFFAESMFTKVANASKVAMVALAGRLQAWGFPFFDCQFQTDHLRRMGAVELSRATFMDYLTYTNQCTMDMKWRANHD